ncbi:hypothetical protein ACFV4K_31415 [Nocardia sp. NPDC059764]|uniref:hypothetical protein n=1 Tax=Nocardia sp. NPDC059764 TaxID=3346939 RepID=UPI003661829E
MNGRTMIGTAAVLLAAGIAGAGNAAALPLPATGSEGGQPVSDLKLRLHDAGRHVGERYSVYGLVYSDAAVWTLGFVHGEPTRYYTIDGARVELTGPVRESVKQGDEFTGTITINGKNDSGDPVVALDDVSVIGHHPTDALR